MIIYGSPFRYIQGFGIIQKAGELLSPLGTSFFIVGDPFVKNMMGAVVLETFSKAGKTIVWDDNFNGECADSELKRLRKLCAENGCDAILGIGGGKTMDAAKAISIPLALPVALIPTIAASDAPVSHVAIVYSDTHERLRVDAMPYSPWLVMVDTEIILNAPARFMASGIADAAATKFEGDACRDSGAKNYFGSKPPLISRAICDASWEVMYAKGRAAYEAVKSKAHCQDFEDVVEAATLLSGIGFESGGCAAAHGTMSALTSLPESTRYTHGELVSFGLLVQLCMENRPESFIAEVASFLKYLELPVTLAGVGLNVDKDKDKIDKVVSKATTPPSLLFNMPMQISVHMYQAALFHADRIGNSI